MFNSLMDEFGREVTDAVVGGFWGAIVAIGILFAIAIFLAFYIYTALSWKRIAEKVKHKKPWLAWIPFANVSMWLQMGGFHWAWIFLLLIPVLGWIALFVLFVISTWRVFEKLKYPGWLSISLILPKVGGIIYLVIIGIIAWGNKQKAKKVKKKK